ncbi:dihydrolipoyl dehydrogenase [Agrobacterium larrymoorei]|uniref:Dihydrolipoyl dehydrogenase n=1 Tax=Agrobacterium larrymoorei TaxID=160699 RepID=A0A4D7DTP3_9HYPH|nr:dihydrolipoyl dehydrogenase [Agrobacterium larrymoorei]QCI99858.1 dihydrolipoyl dehydrogenase [Agrobacterium larrymoorei]QYA09703.1 dihydrolipoyl dehydrogenase [Agrobacterium larrymoorei]
MKEIDCKLLVIGAGPGGYVCAIRAGQLGVDTVIVDQGKPGGTCLNVGCIPSKALIHAADEFHRVKQMTAGRSPFGIRVTETSLDLAAAIEWKDGIVTRLNGGVTGLLQKARVKIVTGEARFRDGKTVEVETETGQQIIRAENIVIATGSRSVELPNLPFGNDVLSSAQLLSLRTLPSKLVIVGGGYIGVELGTAFAKMGSEVTIVEATSQILPLYDQELVKPVVKRLQELGIRVMTGAKAESFDASSRTLSTEDGAAEALSADKVLVTVGRRPNTDSAGLGELDLDMAGHFIRIDERCRTSMRGIYAIGDVTGEPMLAHRAMAQGEMVAEIVSGAKRSWDKRCIPAVCFTDPEIVTVGLSPDEARAQAGELKIGHFPFSANGRAMSMADEGGFVRVVARADNHLVLGIQAVGAGVSELSAGFALAIEMGARLEDIAGTIHAHPTRSEAFQEAALKALGHAIHM